uniref:Protein kinase domain-containing protein n=1 Tax=Alexandrium monilatum TaxID=311494 RepID=A0A7S4PWA7_9DINO
MWSVCGSCGRGRASTDDEWLEEESTSDVFEKYNIGDLIGTGGFGEVRTCTLRDTLEPSVPEDQQYAVKIVDLQSEKVQQCESVLTAVEEANILTTLRHPHIIQVLDVFDTDRFLYVVMEFVRGGELFIAISAASFGMLEGDVAKMASQLLEALRYLHQRGIVHRDVKAENLLLTEPLGRSGFRGSIKLIDFGLAVRLEGDCCLLERDSRQLNLVCGTPQYCAPEMWSSGHPDAQPEWLDLYGTLYGPKVDIWSSGVVVYLAIFGGYPFNGSDELKVMARSCDPNQTPSFQASRRCAGFSRASCSGVAFLRRLLSKDQDERPSARQALMDPWVPRCHDPAPLPPLYSDTIVVKPDETSTFSVVPVPASARAPSASGGVLL